MYIVLRLQGTISGGGGWIKIGTLINTIVPILNYDFMTNVNDGNNNIKAYASVAMLSNGDVYIFIKQDETITDGWGVICCTYIPSS